MVARDPAFPPAATLTSHGFQFSGASENHSVLGTLRHTWAHLGTQGSRKPENQDSLALGHRGWSKIIPVMPELIVVDFCG